MMSRIAPMWLTRLVLAVYFAVVPLYGIAATIAAFACQSESGLGTSQGTHEHSEAPALGSDHVALADAVAADPDSGEGAYGGHLCCQLVVTALPSQALPVAARQYFTLHSSPDVFHYVTFLERFQRPPLV